jgi:molybdenum cofactor guanylyltransferase
MQTAHMTECSVLVLAGGRSRRFGRDKLQLDWRGLALRDHVVRRVMDLSDDVIVLAAHDHEPANALAPGVRELRDADSWPGPLVAVAAGLAGARREIALIVAADMPLVPMRILDLLLSAVAPPDRSVAGLEVDGRIEPLPLAVRCSLVRGPLEEAIAAGARRMGALRDAPGAHGIPEPDWRMVDPAGDSLRDIDTQEDLRALLAEPEED